MLVDGTRPQDRVGRRILQQKFIEQVEMNL